jgi:hypothetical protein
MPVQSRPKEARQVKSKVKIMLIIFFDIKAIVHKEFVLVGHGNRENVQRLRPEL